MQIGMIGLGRMGAGMVRRLLAAGHECVVWDINQDAISALADDGATPANTLEDMAAAMASPRAIWMMVPAGLVDTVIESVAPLLGDGDVLVDGGNSMWRDDLTRHAALGERGIRYVDAGVSGGVWGQDRGYCLMVGGDSEAVLHLQPALETLAPGAESAARTHGLEGSPLPAEQGWLHCGPSGAGHFVKMVHNGIEYGLMAAYAEGLGVLAHASAGKESQQHDAETTPLRTPKAFQYELDLPAITELWRRGSVIGSWLLDLTAAALHDDPALENFKGRVSDSGEGRWTLEAAIETGSPAPVLAAALFQRFASRDEDEFGRKVLSAMRYQFGDHVEKPA
ncbi:MAG: decarboxylating 6-phosphogluconate dehydrogenase [Planctomycetes bacterium]|nr:decarboxylating 6-phosphogluconate dehydrogenase [Planctomycetota bacterium]MCP4839961.1 decarboxylating 6-phosphogluconate dehydrogenase [Planctomycetota bacterium]